MPKRVCVSIWGACQREYTCSHDLPGALAAAAHDAGDPHKSATMTLSCAIYQVGPIAHCQQTPVGMYEGVRHALVRCLSVAPLLVPAFPRRGRQYTDHYCTTGQCTGWTKADIPGTHGRTTGCHLPGGSQSVGLAPDPARRWARRLSAPLRCKSA